MSSRSLLFWLVLYVALAAGAGAPPGELVVNGPQQVTVKGRVLDAATGKGLAGALVASSGDPGAATTAGAEGRFSLVVPAGEPLRFEARARGYLPAHAEASPGDLKTGRLPAVALHPAAEVTGRVLGPGNQPLPDVVLEAVPAAALAARPFAPSEPVADRGASDPAGAFRLSGLQLSSRYELRARKAGYLPAAVQLSTASARGRAPAVDLRLQPGRAATGKIAGPDGRPLAGALVILRPSRREGFPPPDTHAEAPLAADDPAAARSDHEGRFRVAQCPATEIDVEVRLAGHAPARRAGFRVGPGTAPVDLGTVVLQPGARLAGRVVSDRGRGIAGAEIFLFDRLPPPDALERALLGRKPDATAGADGSFALADLPAGSPQQLAVRARGFLPATVRGVRPPAAAALARPLLIRLATGAQLTGRVVDERNQPVPGARVGLRSEATLEEDPYHRPLGQEVFRVAFADADGRFTLRNAPQGKAVLNASAEGFVPVQDIAVELPPPVSAPPLVVRLRSGAVVWGRISTQTGEAVAGARVRTGLPLALTDAEGFYRLSGVADGERQVEVRHPSYRRLARTLRVDPGGEHRLDFELPAGVAVEGRVVDAAGNPVAGADVQLIPEDPELSEARSRSDADGRFHLEPVAAGVYRLQATAPDEARGAAPQPVVVAEQPVSGLEVVLARGAVLSGRVLGLVPEELALVSVEAQGEDGRRRQARLDAGGGYRIRALAPGAWLVRATLWQGQKEARARVVVGPADRELTRDLELGGKLTLSGVVLFAEEPLPNATLTVRGRRLAIERTVVTSFDGGFRLEDLEPDAYWLGISQPDQLIAHNQWLEMTGDREITIRLAGAAVSGMVRDAQGGEPIPGALIQLRPTVGPEFLIADSSQPDGSFHLLRVPPGTYRLAVTADGYVRAEQSIQVAAGTAASGIDLALQPAAGGLLQVGLAAGGAPRVVNLLALDGAGAPVLAETRTPDAAGRVRLATLPPGTWQLLVSAPGAGTATRQVTVPGEPVAVTLSPAGRLHLRVPALATTDLLATVTLLGPDQQALWTLGLGGRLERSWPMAAGQTTVDGVPPGTWLVRVESTDGRVWTGGATMAGGGESVVALE